MKAVVPASLLWEVQVIRKFPLASIRKQCWWQRAQAARRKGFSSHIRAIRNCATSTTGRTCTVNCWRRPVCKQ